MGSPKRTAVQQRRTLLASLAVVLLVALVGLVVWDLAGGPLPIQLWPFHAADGTGVRLSAPGSQAEPLDPERTRLRAVNGDRDDRGGTSIGPRVRVVDARSGEPVREAEVCSFTRAMRNSDTARELQRAALLRKVLDPIELSFRHGVHHELNGDASFRLPPNPYPRVLYARTAGLRGELQLTARNAGRREYVLELWPVQTARVTVRDARGSPLTGVPLHLRVRQGGVLRYLRTVETQPPSGSVELAWVEPMARIDEARSWLEVVLGFPGGEGVSERLRIRDGGAQDLSLTSPASGRVRVSVTTAGRPVADGTLVYLGCKQRPDDLTGSSAFVEETRAGIAEFWPVGLGQELRAGVDIGADFCTSDGNGPAFEGDAVWLWIDTAAKRRSITGRILDADVQPRAGTKFLARVLARGETRGIQSIRTDAEGAFRVRVALDSRPGRQFEIREMPPADGAIVVPLPALAHGDTMNLGDVELAVSRPVVRGVVVDSKGRPMPRVGVQFVVEADVSPTGWRPAGSGSVESDARGRFAIYGTPRGDEVWLAARRRGPWRHEPERWSPERRDIRLVMRPAAALRGSLDTDRGVPVHRIRVASWLETQGALDIQEKRRWVVARVDAGGEFHFDALRPGRHTIAVFLPPRRLLTTVTGVFAGEGEIGEDPRLSPLDLSGRIRVVRLRVTDEAGRRVRARAFAYTNGAVADLGPCDHALLLPRYARARTLRVEAEGFVPVNTGDVAGIRDVVLRRGGPTDGRSPAGGVDRR